MERGTATQVMAADAAHHLAPALQRWRTPKYANQTKNMPETTIKVIPNVGRCNSTAQALAYALSALSCNLSRSTTRATAGNAAKR